MTLSQTPPAAPSGDPQDTGAGPLVHVAPTTFDDILGASRFPSANLLPAHIRQLREVRKAKRRAFMMVVGVLVVLLGMFLLTAMQQRSADAAKAEAQARLDVAMAAKREYSYVPTVYTAVSTARSELAAAMGQEVQVSRLLGGLAPMSPPGLALDSMAVTVGPATDQTLPTDQTVLPGVGAVTFTGESRTMEAIADWIERVRRNPDYSDPVLNEVTTSTDGVYTFDAGAGLTDQALSGRFLEATQ